MIVAKFIVNKQIPAISGLAVPETVPQACIDMTKVLEVTTAEDVTGHINSIAVTGPDHVTFVKGTCSEESKWWLNILVAFPKSKGRHKRNATFPGTQATTILQSTNSDACSASNIARNRHNSYHKDTLTSTQSTGLIPTGLNLNKPSNINVTEKNSISSSISVTPTPTTVTTTATTTAILRNSSNNGNSKLWSHNDVVVTTTAATTTEISTKQTTATKTSAGVSKTKHSLTTTTNTTTAVVVDDDDEDDGVETGEDDDDDEEDDEVDEDDEDANSTGEECHTKDTLTTAVTSVCDENNRNVVNEIKNRGKLFLCKKKPKRKE
uniref:PH domain-containing protein n=1 Tax=Glossina palpalis gambiensis TaxID=67801 RepID=A0A1B0BJR4_9MUSC